jgi:clorobiocin biosynthesis protein CloN7
MPGSDPAAQFLDVPGARLYYERQGDGPLLLVTAYPAAVRTLVAHEPPVIDLLPDRDQVRAQIQDIYDTYRTDGPDHAMPKFMAHAGLGDPPGQEPGAPAWQPTPEQVATMRAAAEVFLAHLLRPTTNYRPDIGALRAVEPRILVAVGATSKGQLAHRSAQALADQLGPPAVEFPGDHAGFVTMPDQCAQLLDQLLTHPT